MMMCRQALRGLFATTVLAGGLFAGDAAFAQTQAPGPQVEEIVVTAQRREQKLQDVPMSITAITGADLVQRGAVNFVDYAQTIPSLSFSYSGGEARGSRNVIAIRGVAGSNTTGYYVDDTPIPYGVDPRLVDVDRIEVLRGPQGTLYGSGSMGGTVKIVLREPDPRDAYLKAEGTASYTEKGGANGSIDAYGNLPIVADKLVARFSAYYDQESGVYDRVYGQPLPYYPTLSLAGLPSGIHKNIDGSEIYGGRLAIAWWATDSLTITPSVILQRTREDGATQADTTPGSLIQYRAYDMDEPFTDSFTLGSLDIKKTFGSMQLTSSTSVFKRDWREIEDVTEVIDSLLRVDYANPNAPPLPLPISNDRDEKRFVQEFRLSGSVSRLDWQVGAYYDHDRAGRNASMLSTGMAANPDYVDYGVDDNLFTSVDDVTVTSKALFTDETLRLTDRLEVSAGVRYFNIETSSDRVSSGLFDGGVNLRGLKQEEHGATPRFAIKYKLADGVQLYATAAQGFRNGGTNTPLPATCAADLATLGISQSPAVYKSDSLWNYEAGAKTTLMGGRMTANLSAFQIDWSNIQQSIRLPSCGFNFTGNVGKARIRGFELETNFRPIDPLTISANVSLNDSQIVDPGVGTAAEKGDELLNTPPWKVSLSAQYDFSAAGHDAYLRADFQHVDRSFTTFNQDDPNQLREPQPYRRRDAYNLVNARIGATFGGDVEAVLFVDNLFNKIVNLSDVQSIGLEFPGRPRYVTNKPRTIGVTLRKGF